MSRSNNKEKHPRTNFPLEDDFSKETFPLMKNLMAVGTGKWVVEKISFTDLILELHCFIASGKSHFKVAKWFPMVSAVQWSRNIYQISTQHFASTWIQNRSKRNYKNKGEIHVLRSTHRRCHLTSTCDNFNTFQTAVLKRRSVQMQMRLKSN